MISATHIDQTTPAEVRLAEDNAALLRAIGIVAVHMLASPGAGKTSLIVRTAESLSDQLRLAVVQGSLSRPSDSSPLTGLDLPIVQVSTGGRPHLEASMLREALERLPLADIDLVIIEEIGTLTSPVKQSLGETLRVVVASLPEGEDCPLRYPGPFTHCDAVVLNKLDLLPHLDFDRPRFRGAVHDLNPKAPVFELSCRTGAGLEPWRDWLLEQVQRQQ